MPNLPFVPTILTAASQNEPSCPQAGARSLGGPSSAGDAPRVAAARRTGDEDPARLRAELDCAERQRQLWACELHDSVAQELAAAQMLLASLDEPVPPPQAEARRATAQACVQRALRDVRRLLAAAEQPPAESPTNWSELAHWITDWQAAQEFPVDLHGIEGLPPVSQQLYFTVLRIVQEALRNARQHSVAPGAVVRLSADPHRLRVQISDTGSGSLPSVAPPNCFGLRGIQHRADACGGQIQLRAAPGVGTSIIVELPLSQDTAAKTENLP